MELTSGGVKILKKIHMLMDAVGSVSKDKRNEFQDYSYVSAEAISDKVKKHMILIGLASTQQTKIVDSCILHIKDRDYRWVAVEAAITFFDVESGEYIVATGIGSGMDSGDKAVMKAATAAHKYALIHLLHIPIGDNPEADEGLDRLAGQNAPQAAQGPAGDEDLDFPPGEDTPQNQGPKKEERLYCFCGIPARLYVDKSNADRSKWWASYYCARAKGDPKKCNFKMKTTKGLD